MKSMRNYGTIKSIERKKNNHRKRTPFIISQLWKQRNELLIHDVTCVKYNKEDNIFSHYLTFFQRLSKKMKKKNENKEPKVALISLQDKHFVITIVHNFVGHIKLDTYDVRIQLY